MHQGLVAAIAMHLNDVLDDGARQGLKALIPELVAGVRTVDDARVDRGLAVWCARSMTAPADPWLRFLHETALESASRYLDCVVSEDTCRGAAAGAVDWAHESGSPLQWFRRLLSAHAAARNTEMQLEVALPQEFVHSPA